MKANKRITRGARGLFRMCLVEGVLDEARARAVAQRLAASRRRAAVPLLARFQRLVRLDRDRHTATVESAVPLDGRLREQLEARLAGLYGPALSARFDQNPSLIGGIRIQVGSDVYDGSIRARLAALQARL